MIYEFIHHSLRGERTDRGADTVRHHHKETLGTRADRRVSLLIHIQRTGDIEEIEGEAVHDTTEHKEQYTRHTRITGTEECKTEHPCKHGQQHHILNSEFLQEERNSQNTKGLAYLADGNQNTGVLYGKGIRKSRISAETGEEGIRKTIRDLQTDTQAHTEDEE